MNEHLTIYLCGPINNCSDEECKDWRETVKKEFSNTLDPMRRDYRGAEELNYREIVDLDKLDIVNSDIILAYCPKPSVGSSMEVLMAWQMGKIIVTVSEGLISPWLKYHSTKNTIILAEAIDWIKTL